MGWTAEVNKDEDEDDEAVAECAYDSKESWPSDWGFEALDDEADGAAEES